MDGILEQDHNPENKEADMHRVEIYEENLRLSNDTDRDWELKPEEKDIQKFKTLILENQIKALEEGSGKRKKVVAVQIKGSKEVKKFPEHQMKAVIQKLVDLGYLVVLIDDLDFPVETKEGHVINLCGKTRQEEVFGLIHNVDAVVCWDSALLWVAHTQMKPSVVFLGPTKASTRTSMHPTGVHVVDCAKHVNCSPCVESYSACKIRGKPTYPCAKNVQTLWLLNEVKTGLENILGE